MTAYFNAVGQSLTVMIDVNADELIDVSDSWLKLQSNLEKPKLYDEQWFPLPDCPVDHPIQRKQKIAVTEEVMCLLESLDFELDEFLPAKKPKESSHVVMACVISRLSVASQNPTYKNYDFDSNFRAIWSFDESDFPYIVKGKMSTESGSHHVFTVTETLTPAVKTAILR